MEQKDYRLAAIMYTDIAGFSRMMETNESGALETLRRHNEVITASVETNGGRVIKSVGDVFLTEFPNTVDAVRSAAEIQNAVAEHNASNPVMPFHVRIGVHLGDIYFFEDDALGEGVSIASRLQSIAQPGRICISQDVHNMVASKLDLNVVALGPSRLKGISREVSTYEISVNAGAEIPGTTERGATDRPGSASGRGVGDVLRDNLRSPEYSDFNELKVLVLAEIKKAGRRLSTDDIRRRLPNRSDEADSALEQLADKGFLTRGPRPSGPPRPARPSVGRDIRNSIDAQVSDAVRRATRHSRDRRDWDDRWEHRGSHRRDEHEEARIQSQWDQALETSPQSGGYDSLVEDYKDHVAAAAEREKSGFRGHLISYAAVNAGLFFLWSMVMFGGFPWFLIVAAAWGIGLVSHYQGVRQKVRETRELDQWPGVTREQLRLYRKLTKARNNFSSHVVSNVATSAFLAILNMIVTPGFPWALFPIGFMAIGIFSHLPAFKSKERRLLKRLRETGANIAHLLRGRKKGNTAPVATTQTAPPNTIGYEAEQLRGRIAARMAALPEGSPVGEEFQPVLDNYVEQVTLLDRKSRELDEIMKGIPLANLQRDLVSLQKQRSEATDSKVLAQYDQSISQIQKQQASFDELKNEREILRLRLTSGLSQLKQMEIDVARMASMSQDANLASIDMLKNKSDELSQYLDDLQAGYRELE